MPYALYGDANRLLDLIFYVLINWNPTDEYDLEVKEELDVVFKKLLHNKLSDC